MPVWSETWLKLVYYLKYFGKKFVWISQGSVILIRIIKM